MDSQSANLPKIQLASGIELLGGQSLLWHRPTTDKLFHISGVTSGLCGRTRKSVLFLPAQIPQFALAGLVAALSEEGPNSTLQYYQ